jgi:hypothetical protein
MVHKRGRGLGYAVIARLSPRCARSVGGMIKLDGPNMGQNGTNRDSQNAQLIDFIGTAWWARTTDPQIHNLVL